MQREPTLQVPFGPRDFRAVQAAADANFDSFGAEAKSGIHGLSHRAPESDSFFQLHADGFSHKLSIQLRTMNFLNIDVDLAIRPLLNVSFKLVDLGAFPADDNARARRVDRDAKLVRHPLDLDVAHTGVSQLLLQITLQLQIFMKQTAVVTLGEPAGAPRFGNP